MLIWATIGRPLIWPKICIYQSSASLNAHCPDLCGSNAAFPMLCSWNTDRKIKSIGHQCNPCVSFLFVTVDVRKFLNVGGLESESMRVCFSGRFASIRQPMCISQRRRLSTSKPVCNRICGVRASASEQASNGSRKRPEYVPHKISDPNYVRIFDTTLRDGEQSPGATLTSSEKLEIARNLSKLGVDIIEAGFPIASPDDFEAVRTIATEVGNEVRSDDGYVPVICGLSRTKLPDIDRAWEAVKFAKLPRVHTFIATSKIHMKHKLRMTPDEVVASAVKAVDHLRKLGCEDIEFSPEDASRSDPDFLYHILGEHGFGLHSLIFRM